MLQKAAVFLTIAGLTTLFGLTVATAIASDVAGRKTPLNSATADFMHDAIVPNVSGVFTVTISGTELGVPATHTFLNIGIEAKDSPPEATIADSFHQTATDIESIDLALDTPGGPVGKVQQVPLPSALPLFGTGLVLLGFLAWRRKRKLAGIHLN